jgi:glycosyltransferase involved in cell wall biosynthesis
MKLLLLSEFFPNSEKGEISGGVEARNFYLAKYFSDKITIFTSRNPISESQNQRIFKADVKRLGFSYQYGQNTSLVKRAIFTLACIFNAPNGFDLVEGTNFFTHLAAVIIGKIKKIPVVLWYPDVWIGSWIQNLGATGIFGEILERIVLLFGKNAKFIAISESTKEKLINNGINAKNIIIIPCGVDEDEIENIKNNKEKKYDLVMVNRLVGYKNTETVIRAVGNNSLLIIGDGPEKSNLEKVIWENNLQEKITIMLGIGSHKELLENVALARVFVSASSVEGFNITALEAASLGLPCLLSDIPAHREHQKNLHGCFFFKNANDLREEINSLLRDEVEYGKLSDINKENSQKYFWKNIVHATINSYVS